LDKNLTGTGIDYDFEQYNFTIEKGAINVTFSVEIIDDMEKEDNETFVLSICEDVVTLSPGLILGNYTEIDVVIVDDECKHNYVCV